MMDQGAWEAAELAARHAYGRLLAFLTVRSRNMAEAEDALAEAFASALRVWPERGVPDNPEAWLLTAARREVGRGERRERVVAAARPTVKTMIETMAEPDTDRERLPDDRLRLLFACAHPAIDPAVRTPLMLQTVIGLDAERIGQAFVVPGSTMGQRLVRAKRKIRDAGVPFEIPDRGDLPKRLDDVLAAIYAAFGTGWDLVGGVEDRGIALAEEALFLGRLVVSLLPDEPEPKGLLALMFYCDARRSARRSVTGEYVPLMLQDRALWDHALIARAEGLLQSASMASQFGRFQTEAAIQSVHCQTQQGAEPNSRALITLYDLLVVHAPSVGALISRAVVHGKHNGPERGLDLLGELPPERVIAHQPYWAAKLHLHLEAGDASEAEVARAKAMALSGDPAVRRYLESVEA